MPKQSHDEEFLTNRLREIVRSGRACPPVVPLLKRLHSDSRRFWRIIDSDDELRPYFAVRRDSRKSPRKLAPFSGHALPSHFNANTA